MESILDFEKPIQTLEKKIKDLKDLSEDGEMSFRKEAAALEKKLKQLIEETFQNLSPWQRVQLSRHPARPHTTDYIKLIFEEFTELHGDRHFGDDHAMICGLAKFEGKSVAVLGIEKGRTTKDKIHYNFGMAKPEGYRKALRVLKLAGQFHIPVVVFIDTPGAFPGIDAEERGQAEAIARAMLETFDVPTPILAIVIGEGGSGGALAIGVADKVFMQEYSVYSVISPESCASILWSDSSRYEQASEIMKMTPEQILPLGVIDGIIKEPLGGAHRSFEDAASEISATLKKELPLLMKKAPKILMEKRKQKFRHMGTDFIEETVKA